jgi:SAM-dependent methyltransferase
MRVLRHWKTKGLIQKALASVPGGVRLNDLLQQRLGDLRDFEGNVGMKADDWRGLMSYLAAVGRADLRCRHIMEIGSGWYPTVPMCFALAGAESCHTVDISRHMKGDLTFRMLRALEAHLPAIAKAAGRDAGEVRERYAKLRAAGSLDELLARANIIYHAPADGARAEWFAAGTVDLVYSNSVLEHVPGPVILSLMKEAHRVLKPNGLMLHAVACNDHYAHFDKSISYVNYLQFTDGQWRLWNNSLNYQNRLRASDFTGMAKESGFEIIHEARAMRRGTREALERLRIAPEFAAYSSEDLAATTVDFVGRKK